MNEDTLIHPGEVLKEEFLVPHDMNANQLATRLGMPANAITAIINGARGVTGPMSILLGRAFGMSAVFFATIQARYELGIAKMGAAEAAAAAERLRRAGELARELSAV